MMFATDRGHIEGSSKSVFETHLFKSASKYENKLVPDKSLDLNGGRPEGQRNDDGHGGHVIFN